MPQYLLLLRSEPERFAGMGPEEMQRIIQKYKAWRNSVGSSILSGQKLIDGTGRTIKGTSMTDGPYAEAKEVMGGFFLVQADGLDEAAALAKECPHSEFGSIEVREIQPT